MELSDARENWKELRNKLGHRFGSDASKMVVAAAQIAANMSPPFGFLFNEAKQGDYLRNSEAASRATYEAQSAALSDGRRLSESDSDSR